MPTRTTLAEKLWGKVKKLGKNKCWLWTGAIVKDGYGMISTYEGTPRHKGGIGAHRASWILEKGPIPKGRYICHHCDNPACVNPKHLYVGTGTDNMRDMWKRRRHSLGPRDTKGRFCG